MRRIAAAVGAVTVMLFSASLLAQANFSGKWAPDTEKNAAAMAAMAGAGGGGGGARMGGGGRGGGGTGPMSITMDAKSLKIERTGQDGAVQTQTYALDGSESKNMMMGRGGQTEQVSKAKLDGAKVVITTTTPNGDQVASWYMEGEWLVNERAIGGNTLKTYYKKG